MQLGLTWDVNFHPIDRVWTDMDLDNVDTFLRRLKTDSMSPCPLGTWYVTITAISIV